MRDAVAREETEAFIDGIGAHKGDVERILGRAARR
jgi:hypothetical protein